MKHIKKLASLLLAVVMILALATTAFADTNPTITAPSGSNHTYKVYQIFYGDLSGDVLSNVKWGKNGTGTKDALVSDTTLNALTALTSETLDATKLAEIEKYVNLSGEAYGQVTDGNPLAVVPGYYLIKDTGWTSGESFYSEYIVQIAKDVTITPKGDVPTSEKKVKDTNDTAGTQTGWQDSADYDVGDEIPYQLTATIPATVKLSNYDKYVVTFVDTISKGLTYKTGSAEISVDNSTAIALDDPNIDNYSGSDTAYTDGKVLTWDLGDIKSATGLNITTDVAHTIVITYTATLNGDAVIGAAGNPNKFHITYYNNPNNSGEGTPDTGSTPDDTNKVFTYKVDINKVTSTGTALSGAGFTLYKEVKDSTTTGARTGDAIKTELAASNSAIKATDLTNAKYYVTVAQKHTTSETEFEFERLDDGNYVLVETTIPGGYNAANSYAFTITATHSETADDPTLLTFTVDNTNLTATQPTGTVSGNIVNNQGSTLPETGGIGTTIFYVLGSVLVVGAAVLLITKRRMSR